MGSVCELGVIAKEARRSGSNINAEILVIKALLANLTAYWRSSYQIDKITIVTDSIVSINIMKGFLAAPHEFDLSESENYAIAKDTQN